MKLFIVLMCFVAFTVADHGKGKSKSSKNPVCSKELSVKPTDCCPNMPSFKQYFEKCATECNQTLSANASATAASEKRGKGRKGNKQFFKCVMPCVIQNAGILGADGNISSDLLTKELLSGATSDWTPIVPPVVSSCFANATAMAAQRKNKAGKDKLHERQFMGSQQNKTCSKFNGMVMKCVFKNLYLSCPSDVLVSSNDCADLTAKISQCPCDEGEHGRGAGKGGKNEKSKKEGKGRGKHTEAPTTETPTMK